MKMERLMTSQQGIQDLEEFQFGLKGRQSPLFHTWSTQQFGEHTCVMTSQPLPPVINLVIDLLIDLVSGQSSGVLYEAFSQELKLKQTILQELAHTVTSDLCMVYLSCWLHQPFIPPQVRLTLESVLLETGHRPL